MLSLPVAGANLPIAKPDEFVDVSTSAPTTLDIFKNDVSKLVPAAPFIIDDKDWTITKEPRSGELTVTQDGTKLVYTPSPDAVAGDTDTFR